MKNRQELAGKQLTVYSLYSLEKYGVNFTKRQGIKRGQSEKIIYLHRKHEVGVYVTSDSK